MKGTDENFRGEGNVCYLDCGHAQIKAFTRPYHTEHFTCMWSTVHQFYLRKVKERENGKKLGHQEKATLLRRFLKSRVRIGGKIRIKNFFSHARIMVYLYVD